MPDIVRDTHIPHPSSECLNDGNDEASQADTAFRRNVGYPSEAKTDVDYDSDIVELSHWVSEALMEDTSQAHPFRSSPS